MCRCHHPQVRHVVQAALTEMRPKRAVKNRKMLCSQWRRIKSARFSSSRQDRGMIGARPCILDRIEKVDVLDDVRNLVFVITEMLQRRPNRLVNDF